MPPKPKFQREEIVSAALDIVRECGIECLTTRNVGAKLNSSARPIFTVFKNMDELKQAVRAEAIKLYEQSIVPKTENTPLFKQLGMGKRRNIVLRLYGRIILLIGRRHICFLKAFGYTPTECPLFAPPECAAFLPSR